ncbi:MAG: FecR domain-containing protein [Bacteroidales bacterium]|nr:FecR domain-containing protein [Bacteroidales bacterium]
METNTDIESLIVRNLTGSATDEERRQLEQQLSTDDAAAARYARMQKIWAATAGLQRARTIGARQNDVWQKVSAQTVGKQRGRRTLFVRMMRVAAVVVPILIIGTALSLLFGRPNYQTFATTDKCDSVKLADNTVVVLNKNSKIVYEVNDKKRNIREIEGIAYFKVARNEKLPFTVDAAQTKITVLGTKFEVENISERNRVHLAVTEGRVRFESAKEQVELTKNQSAICDNDGHITMDLRDTDIDWLSGKIILQNASLGEVIEELLSFYTEIKGVRNNTTNDSVRVTTEFSNQSLRDVIEEINIHFEKKIVLSNGYLTITD